MFSRLSLSLSFCFNFSITLREEDKNIFDYCRENNIDHISKAISSQTVDVNTKDEEVTEICKMKLYWSHVRVASYSTTWIDCYHDNNSLSMCNVVNR